MSAANRESWKTLAKPDLFSKLEFEAQFTSAEMDAIAKGIVPHEMEDKWFIFCEGDAVYFHRSWSGALVYWIRIEEVSANVNQIRDAWVNRDPDQYNENDDHYDLQLLNFLIRRKLLGQKVAFPIKSGDIEYPKGVVQHQFSGTGAPETKSKNPWWRFW